LGRRFAKGSPLAGKRALDVGCGAGLLCEPLARLGAAVTGVDAAQENVAAAQRPCGRDRAFPSIIAAASGALGLGRLRPRHRDGSDRARGRQAAFVAALGAALAPGGLMILSTPNRTPQSRLLLVEAAERIGMVPRGTHHWDDFVTPDELRELLAGAGLRWASPGHRLVAGQGPAPVRRSGAADAPPLPARQHGLGRCKRGAHCWNRAC
jgi:2-polyprenyl-6-hydroxyphenyl methylase / 3-demethylubiquinone-9 3-methyltransferase